MPTDDRRTTARTFYNAAPRTPATKVRSRLDASPRFLAATAARHSAAASRLSAGRATGGFMRILAAVLLCACAIHCGPRREMKRYAWPQNFKAAPDGVDRGTPCTAESAAIAVVSAASEKEVLEILGIETATRSLKTFHEAEQAWSAAARPVQVWSAGGRTIIVEPNGFQTSLPEQLEKLSRKAEAASVYWNVAAGQQVAVAHRGLVIRIFDPMFDPKTGQGAALPQEKGLPFGKKNALDQMLPASLLFLERRTGFVASAEAILSGKKPTYRLPQR